jgi:hypothetical protein
MSNASRFVRTLLLAAILVALILGAGGRLVMRLLAMSLDRPTNFSLGGSMEVVAYGALLGLGGGLIKFVSKSVGEGKMGGVFVGLMTFALARGTLPGHIADTATPFADHMVLVYGLFGTIFVAFGIALSIATSSSPFAKPTYRD